MTSLIEYILTAAAANVPLLLCSDPGMGKTALAAAAAKSGGYDFISFSGAVLDPVYLGGVPMRRTHGNDDGSHYQLHPRPSYSLRKRPAL